MSSITAEYPDNHGLLGHTNGSTPRNHSYKHEFGGKPDPRLPLVDTPAGRISTDVRDLPEKCPTASNEVCHRYLTTNSSWKAQSGRFQIVLTSPLKTTSIFVNGVGSTYEVSSIYRCRRWSQGKERISLRLSRFELK